MHPDLIDLGFLHLKTYGACMAVGFILCWTLIIASIEQMEPSMRTGTIKALNVFTTFLFFLPIARKYPIEAPDMR